MRKITVLLILLLLINLMVFAESLDKDTLTLVVPGDSVTIGFSSDSEGKNVLTASTSKLSSVKTPDWNSSTPPENYNSYATAYLEFYVFWDVFVGSGFKLTLTVPENFKNAKTGETLNIIASGNGMPDYDDNTQVLGSKGSYEIATIKADSVNSGSKKCIIAVDISKAKYGATYKGTLYLKMETVS